MKLIHTADIHLDASYASASAPAGYGKRRRRRLREVFEAILSHGQETGVDAILIAGDLFDLDRVSRDTVAFLVEQCIRIAPIPVFIAPGNHDPYQIGSPYQTERWPKNVHIFKEPHWQAIALPDSPLTVHGFGFDGFDISRNPFPELRVPDDGRVHVAVAHGSETGHQPSQKKSYAPFAIGDVAQPVLRYLALGHFHSYTALPNDAGTVAAYSGAPEGHSFNECGGHSFQLITIPEQGKTTAIAVPSSRTRFLALEIDCTPFQHSEQLTEAIRELLQGEPGDIVARVVLNGICAVPVSEALDTVREGLAAEVDALYLIDETQPLEDYEALAEESTSLGIFIQRISREISDAPTDTKRAMLVRAREIGLTAYRGHDLPIRGLEGTGV